MVNAVSASPGVLRLSFVREDYTLPPTSTVPYNRLYIIDVLYMLWFGKVVEYSGVQIIKKKKYHPKK